MCVPAAVPVAAEGWTASPSVGDGESVKLEVRPSTLVTPGLEETASVVAVCALIEVLCVLSAAGVV